MQKTNNIEIKGMYCAACASRIEKAVSKMDGVSKIHVNLSTEKGRVTFDNRRTSITDIIQKINRIGYHAKIDRQNYDLSERDKQREIKKLQLNFWLSAILTLPLAWAMFDHFSLTSMIYVPELFTHALFQFAITLPIQFIIGFPFYERAWNALRNRSANMDVLVVLSTSAAFFYSHFMTFTSIKEPHSFQNTDLFYETSAFIITFILLGKLLEAKTKLKTTEAIKKLYQLQSKTATQILNGKESKVDVHNLSPGDILIVKPGEKVPIDGQVIEGYSTIDESLLTGESIPVNKHIGDSVYAGTMNQNGLLKINVTKRESETTLSQIIRVVEDAQASKAPIQHIADKITEVFVPIVILIACITFVAWYVVFQPGNFYEAIEKVIAVLIIACPCALGLATPTSIMVGSGRAAQFGILFKEGKYLEILGKNHIVVFDKTGTMTRGEPQVTDIYLHHFDKKAFFEIVGSIERNSMHPIAKTILTKAKENVSHFPNPREIVSIPGHGIKAKVNRKNVVIANPKYFRKQQVVIPHKVTSLVTKLEQEGKTVMIVTVDSRLAGVIAVTDEIIPSSKTAFDRLTQMGLDIMMLTGDNKSAAAEIAKKVGITKYVAEVTPQEKANIIRQSQLNGTRVTMVGDGINDAPALTVADVGIAIGTGSDVAIESADVTIIKNDLNLVVDAHIISKKTMKNIKQNFVWAFIYNIIMIPVAMLGFLAPWLAGASMAFSSVSVVLNSLRLKKMKMN